MTYRKSILFVNVLILFIFYSCGNSTYNSYFSQPLENKTELVAVMDPDVPGFFIIDGESYGYQYELLANYGRDLGIPVRIVKATSRAHSRDMLIEGGADIVIGMSAPKTKNNLSLNVYSTQFVVTALSGAGTTAANFDPATAFAGKRVGISPAFRYSAHYNDLISSSSGCQFFITGQDGMVAARDLSAGEYDYLICELSEALTGCGNIRGLKESYRFSQTTDVFFSMSPRVRGLKDDFKEWLETFSASNESALLAYTYMESGVGRSKTAVRTYSSKGISPYDNVLREVSAREGMDWRFVAAIAYHESRFNAEVVSHKGAQGLMQIMPSVARQFNVNSNEVMIPEVNITLAVKLLKKIESSLKMSPSASYEDKMSIILACYNGGIGHVLDARRLAVKYGYNPDKWENVSLFLEKKAHEEYHTDEVVQCGTFRGSKQTLAFVGNVMGKYNSYKQSVAL